MAFSVAGNLKRHINAVHEGQRTPDGKRLCTSPVQIPKLSKRVHILSQNDQEWSDKHSFENYTPKDEIFHKCDSCGKIFLD